MSSPLDNEDNGPPAKRHRASINNDSSSGFHNEIINGISAMLSCSICLDLPHTAIYQCESGHLMCASCLNHLMADANLRHQTATCPTCRVVISLQTVRRNLAVENAVAELPASCGYCQNKFQFKSLKHHEKHECEQRPIKCRYFQIGCTYLGPKHEIFEHERICEHTKKSALEVMTFLMTNERTTNMGEEKDLFRTLGNLLCCEDIRCNDLKMKSYRTNELVHQLYYKTDRFSAFNHQWAVKALINNSQINPHQSVERTITYQLILKTATDRPMTIHFFVLKGPFSDMKLKTRIYKHDFTGASVESEFNVLPLINGIDSNECNRLLSNEEINFRLFMFRKPLFFDLSMEHEDDWDSY